MNAKKLGWTVYSSYYSRDSTKDWTPAAIVACLNAGIDTVANWETTANRMLDGWQAGVDDCTELMRRMDVDGWPTDAAGYFSDDTDTTADQIRPYLQGVNSVRNHRPVGGYGGSIPMVPMLDEGLIVFWWQANAGSWSGWNWDKNRGGWVHQDGTWGGTTNDFPIHPRAHWRQVFTMPLPHPGGNIDPDLIIADDIGAWRSPLNPGGNDVGTLDRNDPIVQEILVELKTLYMIIGDRIILDGNGNPVAADYGLALTHDAVGRIEAALPAIEAQLDQHADARRDDIKALIQTLKASGAVGGLSDTDIARVVTALVPALLQGMRDKPSAPIA